jgi:hypothetical protein
MRTTVDIEEDVMIAIKELARRDGITAGAMISALLRRALTGAAPATSHQVGEPAANYGFRPLVGNRAAGTSDQGGGGIGKVVSNEQINKLRDEQGI